jgi:hypothetical protein
MDQGGPLPLVSTLALAAVPRVVRWTREHVASALSAWGLSGDVADVARLLVSELVTNSIQVSSPDTGRLANPGRNGAERPCPISTAPRGCGPLSAVI